MYKLILSLLIFYIIGWFLFSYKLTEVPPGINGDEAAIGYIASTIAQNGYDNNGKFLPLFTTASWPDWKQPVTIYSTVLVFKFLGTSYFNLRLVSVLFVLLSGTLIFLLTKEVFNQKTALVSLFIFTTVPLILIQSHLAIENIAPLPFIISWLWMMAKYTKIQKLKYLILAGVFLGISLYSYLGLRLIMPVLTVLSIGYIFYINRSLKKKVILSSTLAFIFSIIPFLLLLLLVKNQYPGAILVSNKPQEMMSYQQFFLPYISSFDPSFLFLKGDATPYHSTGKQGMFLLSTLPLFILGLIKIIKDKNPFFILVILTFFFIPILYGLPGQVYRASRLMSLIPFFVIIATLGFQVILETRKRVFTLTAAFLVIMLITLNFLDFSVDYWSDYPKRIVKDFEEPIHKVFESAHQLSDKDRLDVYIQEDLIDRNKFAYSFFENSYFPNSLKRWKSNQDLPNGSIVIASEQVLNSIKTNFETNYFKDDNLDLVILKSKSNL